MTTLPLVLTPQLSVTPNFTLYQSTSTSLTPLVPKEVPAGVIAFSQVLSSNVLLSSPQISVANFTPSPSYTPSVTGKTTIYQPSTDDLLAKPLNSVLSPTASPVTSGLLGLTVTGKIGSLGQSEDEDDQADATYTTTTTAETEISIVTFTNSEDLDGGIITKSNSQEGTIKFEGGTSIDLSNKIGTPSLTLPNINETIVPNVEITPPLGLPIPNFYDTATLTIADGATVKLDTPLSESINGDAQVVIDGISYSPDFFDGITTIVNGSASDEVVYGTSGNDALFSSDGSTILWAKEGDDILAVTAEGSFGLFGGEGNDTFVISHDITTDGSYNIQDFEQGKDKIDLSSYKDITSFEQLSESSNGFKFFLGGFSFKLNGFPIIVRFMNDELVYLNADDFIFATKEEEIPQYNTVYGSGFDVYGTNSNDEIFGTDGWNDIFGYQGDDMIHSGKGWDWLYGGQGNDTFVIDNVMDDTVEIKDFEQGSDLIDLSQFESITSFEELSITQGWKSTNINLNGHTLKVQTQDWGDAPNLTAGDFIFAPVVEVEKETTQSNTIYGSEFNVYGTSSHDIIYGTDGWNDIFGYQGDDMIHSGKGWDWLYGGQGHDIFVIGNVMDDTVEIKDFEQGSDIIDLSQFESITAFEQLSITTDWNNTYIDLNGHTLKVQTQDGGGAPNLTAEDFSFVDNFIFNGTISADITDIF